MKRKLDFGSALLSISGGNGKLSIPDGTSKFTKPHFSLIPIKDCINCSTCKNVCYDIKSFRYPSVIKARTQNSTAIRDCERNNNYGGFIDAINGNLSRRRNPVPLYRIHVGGDFLYQQYLDAWKSIARRNPNTIFLAFSKSFSLDYRPKPKNLVVVWSIMPTMETSEIPEKGPKAYMQDGTETRIPKNAVKCPGNCDTCGLCWLLGGAKSVYFMKH